MNARGLVVALLLVAIAVPSAGGGTATTPAEEEVRAELLARPEERNSQPALSVRAYFAGNFSRSEPKPVVMMG